MKALSLYPRLNYNISFRTFVEMNIAMLKVANANINVLKKVFPERNTYHFNYARSGLQFILSHVSPGKRVAIQPYTCPTVLEAIRLAGCSIVFLDIDEKLLIDVEKINARLDEFDVLIITHLFGNPASIEKVKSVVKDKLLIEDCSHAFMSKNENNRIVGLDADFSIFSHGFAKFPSAIKGGFVMVNNQKFQIEFERKYNKLVKESNFYVMLDFCKALIASVLHFPLIYGLITSRLKSNKSIFQTKTVEIKRLNLKGLSVLISELKNIDEKINKQKRHSMYLEQCVMNTKQLNLVCTNKGSNAFMLPIITQNPLKLIWYLKEHGIEVGQHFKKTHDLLNQYGYKNGFCPYYEFIYDKIVVLPTHYNYSDKVNKRLGKLLLSFEED